jgi:hypothetical protein
MPFQDPPPKAVAHTLNKIYHTPFAQELQGPFKLKRLQMNRIVGRKRYEESFMKEGPAYGVRALLPEHQQASRSFLCKRHPRARSVRDVPWHIVDKYRWAGARPPLVRPIRRWRTM